jgi:hypothetical protein
MTAGVVVPIEALATLRRRLAALSGRHPQREALLSSTAELYAVSRATFEFIPIRSSAAKAPDAPGNYAMHSRFPSPDRGCPASTAESDL